MSHSPSRPIGSLIGRMKQASASPTRSPHGEHGSAEANSSLRATPRKAQAVALVEVPQLRIGALLPASDVLLLNRWWSATIPSRPEIGDEDLVQLQAVCAAAIARIDRACAPGTEADVAELLLGFVEMLNTLEPGPKGIELFCAALEPMPLALYDRARIIVARTHKYRNLPTPADFFAAVAGELAFVEGQRNLIRSVSEAVTTTLNRRDHNRRMFQ